MSETDRLEAFSDGVMAVVITLMAFAIKPPTGASLADARSALPALLVYVLSFGIVGTYWSNHHHLLRATALMDASVMWANLHLLFWVSLIPAVTGWVAAHAGKPVPTAAYGVVAFASGLAFWILVHRIATVNGPQSPVARMAARDIRGRTSLVVYAAGVGLAWVAPVAAYVLFALVPLMWFVPDRRYLGDENRTSPPAG